jgi:hypothetical protein
VAQADEPGTGVVHVALAAAHELLEVIEPGRHLVATPVQVDYRGDALAVGEDD